MYTSEALCLASRIQSNLGRFPFIHSLIHWQCWKVQQEEKSFRRSRRAIGKRICNSHTRWSSVGDVDEVRSILKTVMNLLLLFHLRTDRPSRSWQYIITFLWRHTDGESEKWLHGGAAPSPHRLQFIVPKVIESYFNSRIYDLKLSTLVVFFFFSSSTTLLQIFILRLLLLLWMAWQEANVN